MSGQRAHYGAQLLIDEIRMVTGQLYGATTYSRLLRDVAQQVGVSRNPSSRTLQKAIARASPQAPGAPPLSAPE